VVAFGALGFLTWTVGAWAITGQIDFPRAIFATLAVFVMGYPCALGMATPLAMIRGGGEAAQKGILMRSGEAFQVFKDIKQVVLDKTGTITRGKPAVTDIVISDFGLRILDLGQTSTAQSEIKNLKPVLSEAEVSKILWLAASVERASEHPLGRAIVDHALAQGINLAEVRDFEAAPGQGVRAVLEGRPLFVGSPAFFTQELQVDLDPVRMDLERLQTEGKTVVLVGEVTNGDRPQMVGLIAVADTLKDDAREAIARLKAAGLEPIMITGDNERTARAVAAAVGIEQVLAEVLPNEKAAKVRELQAQGYRVAMVGDGINDAPALMQADVGIAIGAGTDIAIESSDVVLIGERLTAVVDAYHIGRISYRKTVQNLALAFAFNGIGVPLAVTGLVHPVWAMIAMVASVTAVLANSFLGRLLPRAREAALEAVEHTLELHVLSMHCEGCLSTITQAVTRLPEVEAVEGDLKAKIVTVRYRDGRTAPDKIRRAIDEAGFPVG
jgi:heavy metal translocating P-type ATPase